MSYWGLGSSARMGARFSISGGGGGCWKRFFFIWEIANIKLRSFISHAILSDWTMRGPSTRFSDVASTWCRGGPPCSQEWKRPRRPCCKWIDWHSTCRALREFIGHGRRAEARWNMTTMISHVSDDHKKQEAQLSQKRQCVDRFWPKCKLKRTFCIRPWVYLKSHTDTGRQLLPVIAYYWLSRLSNRGSKVIHGKSDRRYWRSPIVHNVLHIAPPYNWTTRVRDADVHGWRTLHYADSDWLS